MADNIENMTIELLKRLQASLDRVENKVGDLTIRMANVEDGPASIIQHLGHLAAADATQQRAIDHINVRLDRIERRLELTH